jgi:cyclophilin family peptidyl-prolyl cis-trans isomerase
MFKMRKILLFFLFLFVHVSLFAQVDSLVVKTDSSDVRHQVLLKTSMGDITVELYNETPKHRDNFLRLVRSGYYDGNLWHRVIADFMIQTGDSTTRHAAPGKVVGDYDPGYKIPAEICFPKYFHKRGALAAAREGDADNPKRESSASQFYLVWGFPYGPKAMAKFQARLDSTTNGQVKFPPEMCDYYWSHGGTPWLDGQYTVFGEVVKGLKVVGDIDAVATDDHDRPKEDVRIIKAIVVK